MLKKVTWRFEVTDLPANLMEPYFISMYNYKYNVKDIFFFIKKVVVCLQYSKISSNFMSNCTVTVSLIIYQQHQHGQKY